MVGGERQPRLTVEIAEVREIPGAVAHVDLGVVEIRDDEAVSPGPERDPLRRLREELHQPDRARARARVGVELALRVDHAREQRGRQIVVPGMCPDDRLVAKRVADPLVPLRLGRDDPRRDPRGRRRGEQQGDGETLHARADASASASACSCRMTSPTHAPRSSYVPVLT